MNTIVITARVAPLTSKGELVLRPTDGALTAHRTATILHRRERWAGPADTCKSSRPAGRSPYATLVRDSWGERGLYLLLAAAAFAGILIAVLNVLEQAQNWPLFNAWVGRILGA